MIAEHVERFNQAGREAIGEAYAAQPPDDEIVLLYGDGTYAWAKEPEIPAGQMFLTERDGEIAQLVIRYDRQGSCDSHGPRTSRVAQDRVNVEGERNPRR